MLLRPALLLAAAIAVTSAAPARASIPIAVSVDGGDYQELATLDQSIAGETIALQSNGQSQGDRIVTGASIQDVARAAGVATTVTSATVFNPTSGSAETFTPDQIYDGDTAEPGNTEPKYPVFEPYVSTNVQLFQLFWPIRTADDDNFPPLQPSSPTSSANHDLYVELATDGRPTIVVPRIDVTPDAPDAGAPVAFSLSGPVSGSEGQLTYAWDFGDGTGSPDEAPTHVFKAGTYDVRVTVTDAHHGRGVSPQFDLVVGSPPPTATGTPSAGGTGSSQSLPTGPVDGGHAPTSAPTPGVKPGRTAHSGTHHPRRSRRARPRPTATASATPTTSPRPTAAPAGGGGGSSTGSGARSDGRTPAAHPGGGSATATPAPPAVTRPAPKRATGLEGVLVGAAPAVALAQPQTAAQRLAQRLAAARKAAASEPDDSAPGAVDSALGAGVVIIVLALGALRELDPRARYRKLAT